MRAYIYQADIYCESCARAIMANLRARGLEPEDPILREDSDSWPVGPYPNGGGGADYPQHCGGCGVFLENPLTSDGEQYVLSCAREGKIPDEWVDFYGYLFREVVDWEDD